MQVSRRDLLKAAACGSALAATAAVSGIALADEAGNALNWDAEYDVVVMGFGFAGASAALAAADAGASVLIAEKAPINHEGGNSRYCAQLCMAIDPAEREQAITYYKALRGRYSDQSDEIIEAIVDGLSTNGQWMLDHGLPEEDLIFMPFPEYPEFEGAQAARVVLRKGMWHSQLYKYINPLVREREDIDFWSSSPVVELIQDRDTKAILGVVVEHDGEHFNVRAKNGVVMACGGFENNQAMLQNFVQQPGAHSKAARYNDGDGVKLAIEVGADLWHMSTLSGADVNFIDPTLGIAAGYAFTADATTVYCTGFSRYNSIIVGGQGTRFMNETYFPRHGHINYGGTYRSMLVPDNCWCIFDETARTTAKAYHSWSDGMVDEIEKGWILKADTIEELAELCGIDPAGLADQVALYNQCCADGDDFMYHRPAEWLNAVETAPFYAFEVRPTNTNTQGGARRNAQCEVVDTHGNPIPHLYSAGEFGSFYADIYNGGGNVGECIFTGRIAGTAAAAAKDDADQASQMTESQTIDFSEARPEFEAENDNESIGVGHGIGGDVVVKVTKDGDTIADIQVLYHNETPGIGTKGLADTISAILDQQQTVVDVATGCTISSCALMDAVNKALGTGIEVDTETDMEKFKEDIANSVD